MLISIESLIKQFALKITGILHIGAHECEELEAYGKVGIPAKNVIWIEANPEIVKKNHARQIPNVLTALISNQDDQDAQFIVTNNFQSSSMLELDWHKIAHPEIHETGRLPMKTVRVDTLLEREGITTPFNFVNLDIQGAELAALQSLGKFMDNVQYVYCEVNFRHLYKDCPLIGEIDAYLLTYGFERVALHSTSHGWGDAMYIRQAMSGNS